MPSVPQVKARAQSAVSLNRLTATELTRALTAGETSCEAIVRDCLARIDARDHQVHAWVNLDAELALRQARSLDAADASMRNLPLHGVPIGVKDIFDTADLATECGSPIYAGYRPRSDAAADPDEEPPGVCARLCGFFVLLGC